MFVFKVAICLLFWGITCNATSWVSARKGCRIGTLKNGIIGAIPSTNSDYITSKEKLIYSCNDGYWLKGVKGRKCIRTIKGYKLIRRKPVCKARRTKFPPTTTSPTTTNLPGCDYNGNYYEPGTTIEEGQEGNWCFATFCDDSGQILHADNFNCGPSTTMPTTTLGGPISAIKK